MSGTKTKRFNKTVIELGSFVLILGIVISIIILSNHKTTAEALAAQLDSGEKYLSELKYEQAVAAYRKAIEIDPKCTDAYIGLADSYIAMEDYEEAVKVLEEAERNITDGNEAVETEDDLKRIREKKEETEEAKNAAMNSEKATEEPTKEPTEEGTPSLSSEAMETLPSELAPTEETEPTQESSLTLEPTEASEPEIILSDFKIVAGVLVNYHGKGGKVTIPKEVTKIGYSAFYNCSSLTSVTIPESVKSIEEYAFCGCSSLTSVTISEGVKSIEASAFWGTPWFSKEQKKNPLVVVNGILIDGTACSGEVIIPKEVTWIGDNAFKEGDDIIGVMIPTGVVGIGASAFEGCNNLTSVTIPKSVTNISNDAFEGVENLKIYGEEGSRAQRYANEKGFKFVTK